MDEITFFRIGLDHEATDLLMQLAVVTGQPPRDVLSKLVRDILIEDAEQHGGRPVLVEGGPRLN